jgi:paired amphipathic helix protein Sin3a
MRDDTTFEMSTMERMNAWQYYTSSYIRTEPTEGVPRRYMHKTILTRNRAATDANFEEAGVLPKPLAYHEDLTLRICVNTYKMMYKEEGNEYFIYTDQPLGTNPETTVSFARERLQKFEESRSQRFKEKFEKNNAWMKNLSHDEVSKINMNFKKWTDDGVIPSTEESVPNVNDDVTMAL